MTTLAGFSPAIRTASSKRSSSGAAAACAGEAAARRARAKMMPLTSPRKSVIRGPVASPPTPLGPGLRPAGATILTRGFGLRIWRLKEINGYFLIRHALQEFSEQTTQILPLAKGQRRKEFVVQ